MAGIGAPGIRPSATAPGFAAQPPPPNAAAEMVARVSAVDKRFGSVQALRRLNIDVPKSKITVLLGPNGAGKTTAIRMITGAMSPDAGQVSVFGADPTGPEGESVRQRCGVVSAKPSLYDRLSGLDNLRYAAELYALGRGRAVDKRITEAADRFGIADALDQRVGGYSTGMKTRLALARSILHEPQLLLLDEPTSGLDPESAQAVLAMVRNMTSEGRSVLMCTHLLLEAEGLADEVVIVQDGTSLMWGDPSELSRRYWPRPAVAITAVAGADLENMVHLPEVVNVSRVDDTSTGGVSATVELVDAAAIGLVIHRLSAAGIHLISVVPQRPSLEDLYFAVRREHEFDRAADLAGNPQELGDPSGSADSGSENSASENNAVENSTNGRAKQSSGRRIAV